MSREKRNRVKRQCPSRWRGERPTLIVKSAKSRTPSSQSSSKWGERTSHSAKRQCPIQKQGIKTHRQPRLSSFHILINYFCTCYFGLIFSHRGSLTRAKTLWQNLTELHTQGDSTHGGANDILQKTYYATRNELLREYRTLHTFGIWPTTIPHIPSSRSRPYIPTNFYTF